METKARGAEPAKDEQFALGFMSALVSEEVLPTEALLKARGWTQTDTSLRYAAITKWHRKIDGRLCHAYVTGIGRMGQTASAIETFAFLTRCNPSIVFLTGLAGSLKRDRVLRGDVVVSLSTRWRSQNKVSGGSPCHVYRPCEHPVIPYTPEFSKHIQQFIAQKHPRRNRIKEDDLLNWNVHAQEVFSWDYVLSAKDIVDDINRQFPNASCVEMEGGGFLGAIEKYSQMNGNKRMKGLIVKGISDYADAKGDDDFAVRQAASTNSVSVGLDIGEWLLQKRNAGLLLTF